MSRISLDLAESIASKEADKKYDDLISKSEAAFKTALLERVKKQYPVPVSVMKVMNDEDAVGWIRHSTSVTCRLGDNYSDRNWSLSESLPIQFGGSFSVEPTSDIRNKFDRWKLLTSERDKFRKELRHILLGLKTFKRIVENLPELKGHFESKIAVTTALVPMEQIKKVRSQLVR